MGAGGLRVAVVGATRTWHAARLGEALRARGHAVLPVPATRVVARVGPGGPQLWGPDDVALHEADAVLVRGVPRGSLEQVVFRLNGLHTLEAIGVVVLNPAPAIERTVDKFLASALLAAGGVPTPRTVVCERAQDALAAFADLGSDVVVKPVFGAMGAGIARIQARDVAHRVFRALELERAVYYVQEAIDGPGRRDLRALVLGGAVVAAIERRSTGWRANVARGAVAVAAELDAEQAELCVRAAALVGAPLAGVDLLVTGDGATVVEVNGIPGWQALQQATGIDVAALVVEHLEAAVGR